MAQAIKRDKGGRKKKRENAAKRGAQLEPREFTYFMSNVGEAGDTEELEPFKGFDERWVPPN